MRNISREISYFFVGIMFLTRLPVPSGLRHVEGRLARSSRFFPLVGVLVGVLSGLTYYALYFVLPADIAAGIAIIVSILATGALHEDGLADCADGIGGGLTRERRLEIMRDSRIGTYGCSALVVSLGLRWMALAALGGTEGLIALVVAHSVSRAMIPPVLVSSSYARTRGLASSVAGGVSYGEAAISTILAAAIAMIAGPIAALAAFAAAILVGGLMLSVLVRTLGGYTGDGLGAIQQCAEIAILIVLAGLWT